MKRQQTDHQNSEVTESDGRVSWGPKLFLGVFAGVLVFFWWLLIYSGGAVIHHG